MSGQQALDMKKIGELWSLINSLGGSAKNEYDAGYTSAIDGCLYRIELLFRHTHVRDHLSEDDEICAACGLNLRHDIHSRLT